MKISTIPWEYKLDDSWRDYYRRDRYWLAGRDLCITILKLLAFSLYICIFRKRNGERNGIIVYKDTNHFSVERLYREVILASSFFSPITVCKTWREKRRESLVLAQAYVSLQKICDGLVSASRLKAGVLEKILYFRNHVLMHKFAGLVKSTGAKKVVLLNNSTSLSTLIASEFSCLTIQHGFASDTFFELVKGDHFVFDQYFYEKFRMNSRADVSIFIGGIPWISRNLADESPTFDLESKRVLYISQLSSVEIEKTIQLRLLIDSFNYFTSNGYDFVVRLHPADNRKNVEQVLRSLSIANYCFDDHDSLNASFAISRFVVSMTSTCLYEASLLGVETVQLLCDLENHYESLGFVTYFLKHGSLSDNVRPAEVGGFYKQEFKGNMNLYFRKIEGLVWKEKV